MCYKKCRIFIKTNRIFCQQKFLERGIVMTFRKENWNEMTSNNFQLSNEDFDLDILSSIRSFANNRSPRRFHGAVLVFIWMMNTHVFIENIYHLHSILILFVLFYFHIDIRDTKIWRFVPSEQMKGNFILKP